MSADVLLASACLPQIFPPVDIEGEAYWDGGYASNPPVRPLIEAGAPADVILVPTAPMERLEPPPPGTGLARLQAARLHVISAEEAFRALPGGSALDTRWDALRRLRDLGHGSAERWLDDNFAAIGRHSTFDLARFARPAVEIRAEDG